MGGIDLAEDGCEILLRSCLSLARFCSRDAGSILAPSSSSSWRKSCSAWIISLRLRHWLNEEMGCGAEAGCLP